MTLEEMEVHLLLLGVRIDYRPLPEGIMGLYDAERRMILIDSTLSHDQTRSALMHELIHAEYEDPGCSHFFGAHAELRARRLTAERLINREDYIKTEKIYEGNKYLMAKDLDVTVQVLEDYQKILMEGACKNE